MTLNKWVFFKIKQHPISCNVQVTFGCVVTHTSTHI